jgi:hypothetical protein
MAEPELAIPAQDASSRHGLAAGTTGDMGKTQSKLQVSAVEPSRTSEQISEQSATSSASRSGLALGIIEQISEKRLAQADILPASGPKTGFFSQDIPPGFMMPQPVRPTFPGLMKAAENSFTKAEVQSTLTASLAPRSGTLPSQPFRHNENTFLRVKSPKVWTPTSDSNVTKPANGTAGSHSAATPPGTLTFHVNSIAKPPPAHTATPAALVGFPSIPSPTPATTTVASIHSASTHPVTYSTNPSTTPTQTPLFSMPSTTFLAPVRTPTSSSKKPQRSYTLPDGTVATSGKGLGRGRPGIKRGPRKSKLPTEIKAESPKATNTAEETIVVAPPQQKKRKRASSDEPSDPDTPSETSSRASSEEFIPENTQTRSGRQALKPSTFVPSSTSTPVAKRPRLSSAGPSNPRPAVLAKIKRKTYRGREHAALCEHCLRGYGPLGNVIVFCDACNKCWHQRCHEPQVSEAVIKDTKAEWYCSDCEKIINGPKKGAKKATPKSKPSLSLSLAPAPPLALVGASSLTREQREAQLSALSKEKLIELLMRATDLAPALPLFENPNPPVLTTPTISRPVDSYPTPTQEEDDYEYLYDEHATLYPKPGNGVKLPPESVDLAMLLEGPDCKTFSHNLLTEVQRGPIGVSA